MKTAKNDLLFVYGTLMSSFSNQYAVFLRRHARLLGEATTQGLLYKVSWYPALVTADEGGVVWGELYDLADAEVLLPVLDEYEGVDHGSLRGDEYERRKVVVRFKGNVLSAWTYVYTAPVKGEPLISGKFCAGHS